MTTVLFLWLGVCVGAFIHRQFQLPRQLWVACQNDFPSKYFRRKKRAVAYIRAQKIEGDRIARDAGFRHRIHHHVQMVRKGHL